MLAYSDLLLLSGNLTALSEIPYFNPKIYNYIDDLIVSLNYCIENFSTIHPKIISSISTIIWSSYNHISNSNTKEIPYEMEYLLQQALSSFMKQDAVIITAFTNNNMSFYFSNVNVISEIKSLLPDIKLSSEDVPIIQIAMPSFYSKNALYMIPMYHELGHFIDRQFSVSEYMLLSANSAIISYLDLPQDFESLDQTGKNFVLKHHFSEYFCDTFASCFVGETITDFLTELGASNVDSATHPATIKRSKHIKSFLTSKETPLTLFLNQATSAVGMRDLNIRFIVPDIDNYLNETITFPISSKEEAHGTLISYWNFLKRTYGGIGLQGYSQVFRVTNDLVIKSIRSFSIRERWNLVNSNPGKT